MKARCNPVMVEVTRGEQVESRHRAAAAVVRADGGLTETWGDVETPVFTRSSIKPLQALPLLETGAAERFAVDDAELALACASHGGEPKHVARVAAWLERLGLSERDLTCGPHAPLTPSAADALVRSGEPPCRLHNNCSGKHAGFLTTALFLREPAMGYGGAVHPVQLRVKRVLAQVADGRLDAMPVAVDGCNVPTFALPLRSLALAMARMARPSVLGRLRADAATRIIGAMTAHPDLVGGEERFDSRIMAAAAGTLVVKGGGEAVHTAILVERGLGIALKIDDGGRRAAECLMAALLLRHAEPEPALAAVLGETAAASVRNTAGARVGTIRAVLDG